MVVVSEEALSPAATVRAGRKSRTPFPKSLQVGAHDSSSDEDWESDDEASDDEDGRVSNRGRGRVRLHAAQLPTSSALDDEDEQRKCLAEKGWARRSVVIRGVSGTIQYARRGQSFKGSCIYYGAPSALLLPAKGAAFRMRSERSERSKG